MIRVTGRVLSLPTAADVREEAGRAGVEPGSLERFASGFGAEMVKLSGLDPAAVAGLERMIAPPAGLVVRYPDISHQSSVIGQDRPHPIAGASSATPLPEGEGGRWRSLPRGEGAARHPAPSTQHPSRSSVLGSQSSVLLAGSRMLLLDAAARMEVSGVAAERAAGEGLRLTLERYDGRHLGATRCGGLLLEWGRRTYVMGIVNVTPDSFSGDGLGTDVEAAVAQALRFVEEGADILDVGGESTRPGSETISDEEEIARVVPVIRRLARETSAPISVDSYKPRVVRAALDAGATIVNDIWGLRHDPALARLAAEYGAPIVLMHNRRAAATRTELGSHFKAAEYSDLMGEIVEDLRESVDLALQQGVRPEMVIVDPGIGFGKTPPQNIVVMRRQRELRSLGRPILVGTSRKSFIGLTLGLPAHDRVEGTAATLALSIANGADIVRVHDVKQMARVARMTDAIVRPVMSDE